jgi:glycosyltransferase involved in cell wall biosynthesis
VADSIVLTIAIPTYNGARTIARTVASILPELRPGVEVLISDNASTDGTATIAEEFAGKHPAIRYFRNKTNVGFDRNVDLCLERAAGAFVWILSDDDIICRQGAVDWVLEVIRTNPDVAAIFVDSRHPIRLKPKDTGICRDGADFFRKSQFKCGLVSSNIFRKSVWQMVAVNRYFDSGWIHMGFLMEALARFPGYVICEELVAQLVLEERGGVMRWGGSGTFLRTGLNLVRIYRTMPEFGYDTTTVRQAYLTIKGGYLKNIPLAKAKGLRVAPSLIRDCVELYWRFPTFWLLDLPLLLTPGWLFRGARAISHALSSERGSHGH